MSNLIILYFGLVDSEDKSYSFMVENLAKISITLSDGADPFEEVVGSSFVKNGSSRNYIMLTAGTSVFGVTVDQISIVLDSPASFPVKFKVVVREYDNINRYFYLTIPTGDNLAEFDLSE